MNSGIRAARIVSGLVLLVASAGCVGYVRGDGDGVVAVEPDVYLFGGYYDGAPYRDYGRRGHESRGAGGRSERRSEGRSGGVPAGSPGVTTVVPSAGRSGGKEKR